ncbi:MAG: pyrroloquinoline quinone precursor peptide PqqA [Gammaproteobacteria bacterium]|nr:pyrroloquinoline quinone precursor peptide PqqA [Gammaproteobacteria bacterium]
MSPRGPGITQLLRKGLTTLEMTLMWTKPDYTEMRYGFEVTMYFASR